MADTSATSTAGAASTSSVPTSENTENYVDVASSEPTTDPLAFDRPKQAARPKPKAAEPEDKEYDLDGEKLKASDLKRLRTLEKQRQELDREAHKRFQDGAAARKAVAEKEAMLEQLASNFASDPSKLFEHFKVDPDQWAEQRLASAIKRSQMTPEQIEQETQLSELESLRKFKAESEKTSVEQKHTQLTQKFVADYDRDIGAAITELGLSKHHGSAVQVLDTLISFAEAGQPIDARTAAQIVKSESKANTLTHVTELAKSNPAALLEELGPEVIALISQAHVAKVQGQAPRQQAPQRIQPQHKPKSPPTFEDVRAQFGIKRY